MRQIRLYRINRVYSTHEIVWENVLDYTHFLYTHRRHFSQFDVLYDDGTLQVFSYVSRVLPLLPLTKHFISLRIFDHANYTFKQIYKEVGKKYSQPAYLRTKVVSNGEIVEVHNKFVFTVDGVFERFPRLLLSLLHIRLKSMWEEDAVCCVYRKNRGRFNNDACVPPVSNLFHEYLGEFEGAMDDTRAAPDALVFNYSFDPIEKEAE